MTSPAITCKSAFRGSLFLTPNFVSIALICHEHPRSSSPLSVWSLKSSCFEFGLSFYLQKLFYFVTAAFLFLSSSSYSFRKSWPLFVPSNSHVILLFVLWLLWLHLPDLQMLLYCCRVIIPVGSLILSIVLDIPHHWRSLEIKSVVLCSCGQSQHWRLMQELEFEMQCFAIEVLFPRLSFVADYILIASGQGAHTCRGFGQFLQKRGFFLQGDPLREIWDSSSSEVGD